MLRSTSNESRGGKFHPLSLFLLSALHASYGKLRFPESSPFGRRSFELIGFQPTRNTIACLQFDHAQRFESTTHRFALQLYGEFNWKYGQIGLLCSLCMRRANEAIIRERLPIPTVDQVLEELNGSTVFSKLDLRHGFHQVELHADSRDITTFVTHDGLFRYKRLSFGVNAAPEKYKHILSQVIADIEGVVNIADHLIVHGKTVAEHDQSLHKLLARLEEKNRTLNGEKCTFGMGKVVFMGIFLSKHGIGPTEEKVRAVKEATRLSSVSEVKVSWALWDLARDFSLILRPRQNLYEYYVERMRSFYGGRRKRRLSIR